MDAEPCMAIEEALLKPYPNVEPIWGQQMHWGTCLHSLVKECRSTWGIHWPRECILLCGTAAELQEPFRLQPLARHVLCVLSTDNHWAVAAGRRAERELLVFDGLQLPGILDLAEAVAEHARERWGQEMIVVPMKVPRQEDSWSCGHRVLAASQWVLKERCSSWPLQPEEGCLALLDSQAGVKKEAKEEEEESRDDDQALVAKSGQKRPQVLDDDDEDEDADPAQPARKRRRKLTAKQQQQQIIDQGKKRAAKGGVTFNKNFQSVHSSNKDACPEGHWVKFLTALGKQSSLSCKSCRQLRDLIQAPAGQEVVPVQAEQAVVAARPYSGSGRPPGGSKATALDSWLARERPGIYTHVTGSVWWCRACKIECNFQRSSQSGAKYVRGHEGPTHRKMLRNMQTQDAKPEQCRGVRVGKKDSLSLDRFQESIETWVRAGMLRTVDPKHPEKDPLEACMFYWEQEVLVMKARACKGHGPICPECRNLADRAMLHRAICKWACIIDQAHLGQQVVYGGREDVMQAKEKMFNSDYYTWNDIRSEVDRYLAIDDHLSLLMAIKRRMCSIPYGLRTKALAEWLEANILNLRYTEAPEAEMQALKQLCKQFRGNIVDGSVEKRDLEVVAAGGLASNRVLGCLVHSFFDMQTRLEKGHTARPLSGRHLDDDTFEEIYFMLGVSAQAKDLLANFGVSLGRKAKLDFQHPMLPWPFLSMESEATLDHNADAIVERLQVHQRRSFFLSVDETYWHPSWQVMSGLCGPETRTVIGGYWTSDPEDCYAKLESAKGLQDSRKARMSVHYTISRSDTLQQSYDACMVPVKAKDGQKSRNQLEICGQLFEAFARRNAGCLPIGIAFDGGSTNVELSKLTLGLLSEEALASCTFWCNCSYEPMQLKHLPFKILHFKGKPIFGSQDSLHFLKRYTLHHCSGTRSVEWGAFTVDLSCMLCRGLPWKAFVGSDGMCDNDALMRMNGRFLRSSWDCAACHLYALVGSLLSSLGQGSDGLPARSRFFTASSCYYLLLLNLQAARLGHGSSWKQRFLPLTTIRIGIKICVHAMQLCMKLPEDCPLRASRFQERASELFFSRAKKDYRGSPSCRDGILGVHKTHLSQLKEDIDPPKVEHDVVTLDQAQRLHAEAFTLTCLFQSWISVGKSRALVASNFELWYKTEGKKTMNDEELAIDLGVHEDLPPEETTMDESQAEVLAALHAVEDHKSMKESLQALAENPEKPKDPAKDMIAAETEQECNSWRRVLHQWSDSEVMEMTEDSSYQACLDRIHFMMPRIRCFIQSIRLREGLLSKAQIQGQTKELSPWHSLQHELAVARAASMECGSRQSRCAAWQQVAAKALQGTAQPGVAEGDGIVKLQHLCPRKQDEKPQVVVYVSTEKSEKRVSLALVLTVFRGALLKGKEGSDKAPRKLKVCKPAVYALPVQSISACRVLHLTETGHLKYFACALSPTELLCPAARILGHLPCATCEMSETKIRVSISEAAHLQMQALQEKPELLAAMPSSADAIADAGADDDTAEFESEEQTYSASDFTASIAGSQKIVAFLTSLPKQWNDRGVPIVDEQNKVSVQGTDHPWKHICLRAPEFLDNVYSGPPKGYGRFVVAQLMQIIPAGDLQAAKKRLKEMLVKLVANSLPVPGPQPETATTISSFELSGLRLVVQRLFGAVPITAGTMAAAKRLIFEAHTLVVQELKTRVQRGDSGAPSTLATAEREERITEQRARITGLLHRGAMLSSDSLTYLGPDRFPTRQSELQGEKPGKELTIDGNSVTVKDKALRRRALAFDLVKCASYDTMNRYHSSLIHRLQELPPPTYVKISVAQVLRADRAAFTRIAESLPSIKRQPDGTLPLDRALENILQDPSVSFHLLPLKGGESDDNKRKWTDDAKQTDEANKWKKNGKGKGKGKGKDQPGAKGAKFIKMPKQLVGKASETNEGKRLCWAYNIDGRIRCPSTESDSQSPRLVSPGSGRLTACLKQRQLDNSCVNLQELLQSCGTHPILTEFRGSKVLRFLTVPGESSEDASDDLSAGQADGQDDSLSDKAAFQERCLRIGMTPELYGKLKDKGYDTFGKIAFAAASSPQALTDEAIDVWLATVVDPRPSAFQVSVIRRLLFESQSLNMLTCGPVWKARLKGVVFTVSNQPSHASIDQVTDMLENNSLRYLPMNRWTSRSQELSLAKKDSSIQIDAEGNLKLGTKVPDPVCDTNGAYALRQAFFRRSLALDLGNLCTFEVMEEWVNTIFELTQRQVPTGYTKVSLSQIVAADKELFIRAANNLEGKLQKPVGATKPLDAELKRLSVSHDITQFLSPLLTPPPPAHPTKRPQDGDDDAPPKKTKGKGDKGNKGGHGFHVRIRTQGHCLFEASNSEVTDNFIEGPYTEAQVTEIFGHSDWGIIPRFVLEQGLEKKIRPIDDGHASQVNEAFTSLIKLELQGADFVAGLALLISQAEKERSERLGVAARKWVGRTLDLSKAYKQLGVLPQHRDIAVICHPNENGEPQFFIANALMFGLTSSVYGFVRVARSLHFLLAKVLKIPSANYFDDYPLFTLRDGAHELDGLTSEFLELLGWRFAQTGVKGQPYEEAFTVLGMQLDISRLHEGAAVLANKEGRVKRISEMLGSIFDKGALGRHEAQVLLGLLNYASGFFAGRSLKPACHFLLSLVRGKRQTAAEIKRFCKTTQAVLSTTPPRVLRIFDPRPPIHVWTDGAWEDPWAGIGAVVLDTLDDSARVFAGCVPAKLLERWKLDVGSQLICEIELYALVTLRRMLQNSLCNRRVIFWLDNEAARTSAIKGLSQSESMYRLAHYLAVIEAEAPCIAWYERVPSFSNIADPPSRGEGHSILSLVGAKVVEAFIHDESSNQRFLHQGPYEKIIPKKPLHLGVLAATEKELAKGFVEGPVSASDIPSDGTVTHRFGVIQGAWGGGGDGRGFFAQWHYMTEDRLWNLLEDTGCTCVRELRLHFDTPWHLACSVDSLEDSVVLAEQILPSAVSSDHKRAGALIWGWLRDQTDLLKRVQGRLKTKATRIVAPPCGDVSPGEVYAQLVSGSLELTKQTSRAHARWISSGAGTPADAEKAARKFWGTVLVQIMVEAKLPIVDIPVESEEQREPGTSLAQGSGLDALKSVAFPRRPSDVVDYLLFLEQEVGTKSCISEFMSALSVLEDAGQVPLASQLCKDRLVVAASKSSEAEVHVGVTSKKQAAPLSVAMLLSLEIFVVAEVPFFVGRDVGLSGRDWLLSGFDLWKGLGQLDRTFLVFQSSEDFEEPIFKFAKPEVISNYMRLIWRQLKEELFEELREWLRDRGSVLNQTWPLLADFTDGTDNAAPAPPVSNSSQTDKESPFWVSISRHSGHRRLHIRNGCWVTPSSCHRFAEVWEAGPNVADSFCKLCYKEKVDPSSSSGESSSTELGEPTEDSGAPDLSFHT
ncbi:unnamed protein product [Symbiodinium sp. CCMP2592]|nr:unnamed protein product [Symbiodinium sp. CCMP2592]